MLDEKYFANKINAYTLQDWEPLLSLILEIENVPAFEEDEVQEGFVLLLSDMQEDIRSRFLKVVYGISIVINFDWVSWDEDQKNMRDESFDFDSVDIPTKCKLITAIVRRDRFCDGVLLLEFRSGLILKILKSIEKELKAKI